ncbi:uncharacterized protein LOC111443607 [Cucurbita moschata]|uniref:Uncharacterized protein LOC111443607 n=1 Tax=Cucurbita moschata TaxID=3662 RepID=A0A6J1F9W6_CUCMO|nr:uncharacterized protein LOC111443607 [Cucurbita moschata]
MLGSSRKLLSSPTESPDFRAFDAMDFGSPASTRSRSSSRPALNHDIFRSWNGKQIHLKDDEAVEYGFRLSSPQRSPQFYRSNYQSLSPPSKALAIATGQKELMELVNNMPESCYELSLRDLVEQPMVLGQQEPTGANERDKGGDREVFAMENRKSKKETSALVGRSSWNMENGGLYLKMGFPNSIGTRTKKKKKKKNNDSGLNTSAKVSPKPSHPVEKDWWKRRLSVSSETGSVAYDSSVNNGSIKSSSSSSSNGSNGSNKNRTKSSGRHAYRGCWSCIYPKCNERDE